MRGAAARWCACAPIFATAPSLPPAGALLGPWFSYPDVARAKRRVLVVGAGPAGLFAALRCVELGMRPIVLERGQRRARPPPRLGGH
ncbi:MAG: FAD-binding protein [Hymenobacter sp.]